jgi:streptogramin lyase
MMSSKSPNTIAIALEIAPSMIRRYPEPLGGTPGGVTDTADGSAHSAIELSASTARV